MKRLLILIALLAGPARADSETSFQIGGGTIDLEIEPDAKAASQPADIERWTRRAAVAVSSFYGRFPVQRVHIVVARLPGRRINGTTYDGKLIRMRLGVDTPPAELDHDWTLTHEMFHLGFPDMARRHLWMQEGLSTYFEPLARARVGDLTPAEVWHDLFEGLPNGLPGGGSGALDETPSWGATYWGGTLFWFLADVRIRERTQNRHSADDAIRAINEAGGIGSEDWAVEKVLAVGDKATGTTVLSTVYQELGKNHFETDLHALAVRLGVELAVDKVRFDDKAPLAAIRRSMTDPKQNPPPRSASP